MMNRAEQEWPGEQVVEITSIEKAMIAYETPFGGYWVRIDRNAYTVCVPSSSFTHSVTDSSYAKDADGLSIAIARCNYLARRRGLQ